MLAHLHNSRLAWLDASAPDLMAGQEKVSARTKADREAITKDVLRAALEQSGRAMEVLFQRGVETGKIKNTRQPVIGFYSYVLAHEWYHIGELCLMLGQTDYLCRETSSMASGRGARSDILWRVSPGTEAPGYVSEAQSTGLRDHMKICGGLTTSEHMC
jgi:hypothetical protein